MNHQVEPIGRRTFDAGELMSAHPPVWRHPNKQLVFDIASPPGSVHRGSLEYTRWSPIPLPSEFNPQVPAKVQDVSGFFDYAPAIQDQTAVEWHVNFADPQLFVAYAGPLFAQDEMQVAEHPALGALREALLDRGYSAVTVEGDRPTPVLVMGVERRCRVATEPNAEAGVPRGLYGNAFASAEATAIRRATTPLKPPSITNLVCMAAPFGGVGKYTRPQIEEALLTAHSGFRAAVSESKRAHGDGVAVVVHTGYWGCGAFGGNRELMAALQMIAARIAGVDLLVFHTGDKSGAVPFSKAREFIDATSKGLDAIPLRSLLDQIVARGYEWGVSDGN